MISIWSESCRIRQREQLQENISTEIAVIGAGMAGILIASALQSEGRQVVVLEARRIASGQTRGTTAKITSQHGLIYHKLIKTVGEMRAKQYAMANETAIREYRRLIQSLSIDCDWEEQDSYLYGNDTEILRLETNAALSLGLPAELVADVSLPFPTAGAVRFSHQAQFNPLKFIKAISEDLTIYEQTPVLSADGELIRTAQGTVHAKHIVFACHYPFINFPGLYFARMHQERSYVIALENVPQFDGMYINAEQPTYSFRHYDNLLLLGGGNHRTGENTQGGQYIRLLQKAQEWFPHCREVARWSAQDCMTPDSIPYIGRYAKSSPNWYVATGFQKWGMSSSMVSAMILRDMICGLDNPYAKVFDPCRFDSETIPGICSEGCHAVRHISRRIFQIPKKEAASLPPGRGGVVLLHGEKVGVYKEPDGTIHAVEIRCPHLGCQLEWNPDEKSWDCPCHGSRFDYLGNLICDPAQTDLPHE